jgi:hypothetical protein
MVSSWFAHIDRAKSVSEVVSVTRDFLATWTPPDLALLPPHCRPGRVRDEQDIETLHSTLVEEYRVSRAQDRELDALQRLTSFIVRVSIRLAELAGPSGGGEGDPSGAAARSTAARER